MGADTSLTLDRILYYTGHFPLRNWSKRIRWHKGNPSRSTWAPTLTLLEMKSGFLQSKGNHCPSRWAKYIFLQNHCLKQKSKQNIRDKGDLSQKKLYFHFSAQWRGRTLLSEKWSRLPLMAYSFLSNPNAEWYCSSSWLDQTAETEPSMRQNAFAVRRRSLANLNQSCRREVFFGHLIA